MSVTALLRGQTASEVAPDLLGWTLSHTTSDGMVTVRLTEVEAYEGESDPASHAYRGRTPRTEVMFGPAAHVYVYRSHGIHWCMNVVTGTEGHASAVLLRAGEVVDGDDLARERRGPHVPPHSLARGPGNLARALGVTGTENGADLTRSALHLSPAAQPATHVSQGPRVGVSLAADVPWRWWLTGDPSVSAYRRSPRAPRP